MARVSWNTERHAASRDSHASEMRERCDAVKSGLKAQRKPHHLKRSAVLAALTGPNQRRTVCFGAAYAKHDAERMALGMAVTRLEKPRDEGTTCGTT